MTGKDNRSNLARGRSSIAMSVAGLLLLSPVGSPSEAAAAAPVGDETESSAISVMMQGLATSVAKGAGSELSKEGIGWAMTSLGLEPDPNAEVVAELEQIEQTLLAMEQELADIETLLQEQLCQSAVDVAAVQSALTATDTWVGRGSSPAPGSYMALSNDAQAGVDVTSELATLFREVLGDSLSGDPSLISLMEGFDDALRDQANSEGVMSACGLLVAPPTGWDDRAYYETLDDLAGYFAEYEARAVLVIVEAYHWEALQAWFAQGNSAASLPVEDLPSICDDPTGAVAQNCINAQDAFDNIRDNMRAQYASAGAPYSTGTPQDSSATFDYDSSDPVVLMDNDTLALWVMDIDDFFTKGGYASSCTDSTSADPCGPGVGTYDHTTFEKFGSTSAMIYGGNDGYTTWQPATADDWAALTSDWSGSSTTLSDLLIGTEGFVGSSTSPASGAARPRVYFTGDAFSGDFETTDEYGYHFHATRVACFVVTPMTKGESGGQPFCSDHVGNLMRTSTDHTNGNKQCDIAENTKLEDAADAGILSPFFTFEYGMQPYTCKSSSHPDPLTFYPSPPGWLLQYRSDVSAASQPSYAYDTGLVDVPTGGHQEQYHWPVLDTTAVTCAVEPATGQTRSAYALSDRTEVPTMCGADFDAWFEKWVAPPALITPDVQLSVPDDGIEVTLPDGNTASMSLHHITATVDYLDQISSSGSDLSCSPDSGSAFGLGTTEVQCRASDDLGTSVTKTFTVLVRYPFEFTGKVGADTATTASAGTSLQIGFSLDGDRGLQAIVGTSSTRIDCTTGTAIGDATPIAHSGSQGLTYQAGKGAYSETWKTDRTWHGQCHQLQITLADGTEHTARVEFRSHPETPRTVKEIRTQIEELLVVLR